MPSSANTFFKQYSFTFTNVYNTEFFIFFLNKTILVVILTIKIIVPKQKKFLEINYEQLKNYKINYPMNKENKTRD